MEICGDSFNDFLNRVKDFHGSTAPGIILGGIMIDHGLKNLPDCEFFDCICETSTCLPDAVQILTPCTAGNGWMHILDHGKFAITFFEKDHGKGTRVYIDTEKLKDWGEVYAWFFKEKSKQEQNLELLLRQIREGVRNFFPLRK